MEVTTQPGPFAPSDFQTGLFECCDDCGTCAYGCCCLTCLGCTIASNMGECCLCGLGMPIRSVYRTKYNIKGSMCKDFMIGGSSRGSSESHENLYTAEDQTKLRFSSFLFFINRIVLKV
ncbi:hypothetical protein PGIGA_G00088030 [Pangasianodon gigas]|uniref:Uncharacterized protein n=1 Tax=Pangasianodon gigas TaxID=30993 RepID=A0ACC5XDI1_PANGG|nr:hypothetical protein [Pangasianodon gigas]